jgi:hypothetical protein
MARSTDIADPSQTRRSEYPRLNHLNISASRGHLRSGDVEIVIEIDYSRDGRRRAGDVVAPRRAGVGPRTLLSGKNDVQLRGSEAPRRSFRLRAA